MHGSTEDRSEAILSVRGEAVLEVEPEIARINVAVVARDVDRANAIRSLDERARLIDGILAAHAQAIERKETASVRVSPQLRQRSGQRVSGYEASVRHRLTVSDFTALGELLSQLADQDLTEVDGPNWSLRPTSPTFRDARTEAAQDAVRRAEDYASALGGTLGALIELADAGLLTDSVKSAPVAWRSAAASAAGAAANEEFTFDVAPGKQVVRATVEARFRAHLSFAKLTATP